MITVPVNCPVCGDVMLTDFSRFSFTKTCKTKLSHGIVIQATDYDQILKVSILYEVPQVWAVWHPLPERLEVQDFGKTPILGTPIPYFEPDLSNYKKLLEKIKTYLVFS